MQKGIDMAVAFQRPLNITTDRCVLSEMRLEDAEHWYHFMNNPLICRFLSDRIESVSEMAGVLNWLVGNYSLKPECATRITLGIGLKPDTSRQIGWVTYGPLPEDEHLREIGYALEPCCWGKGIATEAARAFAQWIFHTFSTLTLVATVDTDNVASIRVLEKIGMQRLVAAHSSGAKPQPHHALYEMKFESDQGTL